MGTADGRTGAAQSPRAAAASSSSGDDSSASRTPLGDRDGLARAYVHGIGHGVATDRTLSAPDAHHSRQEPTGDHDVYASGALLTPKGLGHEQQAIECAIDTTSPFRPDLLAPLLRVVLRPEGQDRGASPQEQLRLGISFQGDVVWQLVNPALSVPAEGTLEDLLTSFLAACLSAE